MAFIHHSRPFDNAVATAAPTAAAELLADVPAPATEPAPESFDVRPSFCDLTPREKLASIAARFPNGSYPTDEQVVAAYCISGIEDQPERWRERYYGIHHIAYQVVRDHRDKILTVARELFARGILSRDEILKITNPKLEQIA